MRYLGLPAFLMLIFLPLCASQSGPQSKKPEPLAIVASAKFVFVEAFDGPDGPSLVRDPRITSEDREAVENVQNAVQRWGYYILTLRRTEADLIVFVRRGHTVNVQSGGHTGNGISLSSQPSPVGASANVDMFCVYSLDSEGKLSGPLWQKNLKDGLSAPKMVLFRDFKNDVTRNAPLPAKQSTP